MPGPLPPDFHPRERLGATKLNELSRLGELATSSFVGPGYSGSVGNYSAPPDQFVLLARVDSVSGTAHGWTEMQDDLGSPGVPIAKGDGIVGTTTLLPLYEINGGTLVVGRIYYAWRGSNEYYLTDAAVLSVYDGVTITYTNSTINYSTNTVLNVNNTAHIDIESGGDLIVNSGGDLYLNGGANFYLAAVNVYFTADQTWTLSANVDWIIAGGSNSTLTFTLPSVSFTSYVTFGGGLEVCGPLYSCYAAIAVDDNDDLDLTACTPSGEWPVYLLTGATQDWTIFGIVPIEDTRTFFLVNSSDFTYTLEHNSTSSGDITYRFSLPNDQDHALRPGDCALVWYDPEIEKHRIFASTDRLLGVESIDADYTVTSFQMGWLIDGEGPATVSLPPGEDLQPGWYVYVRNNGVGSSVAVEPDTGDSINGDSSQTLSQDYDAARFTWTGIEWAMWPDGITASKTVVVEVTCEDGTLSVTSETWVFSNGLLKGIV